MNFDRKEGKITFELTESESSVLIAAAKRRIAERKEALFEPRKFDERLSRLKPFSSGEVRITAGIKSLIHVAGLLEAYSAALDNDPQVGEHDKEQARLMGIEVRDEATVQTFVDELNTLPTAHNPLDSNL